MNQIIPLNLPKSFQPPVCRMDSRVTISDVRWEFTTRAMVWTEEKKGSWHLNPDEYGAWERILEAGKSYLVGSEWTMSRYLKSHTSPLSGWQKLAYLFVLQNRNLILNVKTRTHEWRVYQRGEYVEFALPYHEKGGERNYVSRNGRSKVLVNVD